MKVLQETTKWRYPNNIYVLNVSGKLVGWHNKKFGWRVLPRGLSFSKKYRTFDDIGIKSVPKDIMKQFKEVPSFKKASLS